MKKCVVVVNTHKTESLKMGRQIADYLGTKGIQATLFCFDGFSEEDPFVGMDFAVTLGGDGTVLFAARGCVSKNIPVFPLNFGEFGFIASIQKSDWQQELDSFIAGNAIITNRSMIQAAVISGSTGDCIFSGIGLNDVVICAKFASRTVSLDIAYNYMSLGTFKADGIIVSTPTGSTAYSASAGGPIVDPGLEAMVLTPLNAFSLSSRPLVLSPNGELEVTVLPSRVHDTILTVDGQPSFDINDGDCIKIRQISQKVRLVGCTASRFYEALQSKLNWSGGPHA